MSDQPLRSASVTPPVTGHHSAAALLYGPSIVATLSQPLLVVDSASRVRTANDAFCRAFDFHADKIEGQELAALGATLWQDERVRRLVAAGASPFVKVTHMEVSHTRKDGLRSTYAVKAARLKESSDAGLVLVTFEDVTPYRNAEAASERAHAELTRSNRELSEFASIASHDLQEPLRKIQSFGSLLQARAHAQLDNTSQHYLARMTASAKRLSVLISNLLTLARIGTAPLVIERVDLQAVVTSVLRELGSAVSDAGAAISVGRLPAVDGDRAQLHQLLQNLLSNALKFRREDVPLEVVVDCVVEDTYIEVSVADNGIGLAPEDVTRIFNMFERVSSAGAIAGTGIGLALCGQVVARHGGSIRAVSLPDGGAQFVARLPLVQLQGAGDSAPKENSR